MANVIKYSTTNPSQSSLRKGNLAVGVGDGNYGPTSTTGFVNGMDIPNGGYVVYLLHNNSPAAWVAYNDTDLIEVARTLGNSGTTVASAKEYLAGRSDTWILNNTPPNIVTDYLRLNLNAGDLSSYPTTGNTFYDLSGDGNDGTLTNGPTFNTNGYLDFDGVNDWCNIPNTNLVPSNVTSLTVGGLWKRNGDGSSYETILHQSSNTSIGNSAYWFGWTNDNIVCCTIGARNGVGWAAGKTNIPATVGKWFYTVASWNGSTVSVWVNGILKVTYNLSTYTNPGTVTRLGASGNASGYLANGSIANIHINPNKAFTESEMLTNYYQAPIVTDGLVFAVDAGNLVSYENGDITTNSLVGSSTGTLVNGVGFSSANGGTWDFDGADDKITLPNDLGYSATSVSVFAWYKINGTPGNSYHIICGDAALEMSIHSSATYLRNGVSTTNGRFVSNDGSVTLNDGNYHYYGFTFDGSTKTAYIDGVAVGTQSVTGTLITSFSGRKLGNFGGGHYANGNMTSYLVWNKVLTPSEITQNYNAQSSRFQ